MGDNWILIYVNMHTSILFLRNVYTKSLHSPLSSNLYVKYSLLLFAFFTDSKILFMQTDDGQIIAFLLITTVLILLLMISIVSILYLYHRKKITFQESIIQSQLEIQEETFQIISREIHDNIGLCLTLAKLNLNTFSVQECNTDSHLVQSSIELISQAIIDLSDISKSMNAEAIVDHGLLNAIKIKLDKLKKIETFNVQFDVTGDPVFMHSKKELIVFRIFQESLNNIIKHSKAYLIKVHVDYGIHNLMLEIKDNGIGLDMDHVEKNKSSRIMTGLANIKKRTKMLNGICNITGDNTGTTIQILVPLEKNEK